MDGSMHLKRVNTTLAIYRAQNFHVTRHFSLKWRCDNLETVTNKRFVQAIWCNGYQLGLILAQPLNSLADHLLYLKIKMKRPTYAALRSVEERQVINTASYGVVMRVCMKTPTYLWVVSE